MGDLPLGTWREVSIDKPDVIGRLMGLPEEQLAAFNKMRDQFRFTCTKNGDKYKIVFTAPGIPNIEENYQLGVEYETKDMMGWKCKILNEMKGDVHVERRECPGKYTTITKRTYSADGKQFSGSVEGKGEGGATANCNYVWEKV